MLLSTTLSAVVDRGGGMSRALEHRADDLGSGEMSATNTVVRPRSITHGGPLVGGSNDSSAAMSILGEPSRAAV
jgi:hypothetical protein